MIKVYNKIVEAQTTIAANKLKKAGYNDYSKFYYYTPEQVQKLVSEACKPLNLFNHFDLSRGDLGLEGVLTVTDLDSEESVVFTMAMEIPSIKATNASQQLGGAMTYSKRYMLQNIYDIADNSIDPDAEQGNPKNNPKTQKPKAEAKPKAEPSKKKEFDLLTESKKIVYLTDLVTSNQSARIPDAITHCEANKYLNPISVVYIRAIAHLFSLAESQRADYFISIINSKNKAIAGRILTFVRSQKLLPPPTINDLRQIMNVK